VDTLYINVRQNGKMFTKVREECLAAGMDFLGDGEAGRVTTAGRLIGDNNQKYSCYQN
jgi:hypothetical protein